MILRERWAGKLARRRCCRSPAAPLTATSRRCSSIPLQSHEHQSGDRHGRPCAPILPHDAPRGQPAARGGEAPAGGGRECLQLPARMPPAACDGHDMKAKAEALSSRFGPSPQYATMRKTCPVSKAKLFDGRWAIGAGGAVLCSLQRGHGVIMAWLCPTRTAASSATKHWLRAMSRVSHASHPTSTCALHLLPARSDSWMVTTPTPPPWGPTSTPHPLPPMQRHLADHQTQGPGDGARRPALFKGKHACLGCLWGSTSAGGALPPSVSPRHTSLPSFTGIVTSPIPCPLVSALPGAHALQLPRVGGR